MMSNLNGLNFDVNLGNYLDKESISTIVENLSVDSLSIILSNLKAGSKKFLSYILTNKILSVREIWELCSDFKDLDGCEISAKNRLKIIETSEDNMSLNFVLKFFGCDMIVCKLEDINEPERFLNVVRHSANFDYDSFYEQLKYLIKDKIDPEELNGYMNVIVDRFSYYGIKDKAGVCKGLLNLLEEFDEKEVENDI